MSRNILILSLFFSLLINTAQADTAQDIIDISGIKGGIVVHLDCNDGALTSKLKANDKYLVQGLDTDSSDVESARASIRAKGIYGKVSVDSWNGTTLPYVDNFVNLLIDESEKSNISKEEILRVLTPRGVYLKSSGEKKVEKWEKIVKPVPSEIDDWTHYMHDSKGSCVSKDTLVGPPRRMRWVGSPRHARSHEHTASLHACVSAKGRIFYVMDEGSKASIQLPSKYILSARDAYNGTVLWKKPLKDWFNHLYPLKSGPAYMPRRLVAVDETVYIAPGLNQNLLAIDAATGKVKKEYDAKDTLDLVVSDNVVFAVTAIDKKFVDYNQQNANCWSERDRASIKWQWQMQKDIIKAIDAESGKILWEHTDPVAPMTITADKDKLCYFNGTSVVALDRKNGKQLWATKTKPLDNKELRTGFAPKLIIQENYVLYSPFGIIYTMDGKSGKTLWTANNKQKSGHFSPEDLFVIDDIVWAAGTARGKNSTFGGYDLKTGENIKDYPNPIDAFWMHQRCYPGRATEKYFLAAATGTEFVNVKTGEWEIHHWYRGGCVYGMMPANGLLYATPQACACYYQSKMNGFNALAAEERQLPKKIKDRLTKGKAYKDISDEKASAKDWPVFRHDNERSGYAKTDVSTNLEEAWKTKFNGKISQPVAAGDKVFISVIDEHTVYGLNAKSGKEIWNFTAGGRVDSPPSIYKGMAIFGSADGYIYALRASDGELAWKFRGAPLDQRVSSYEQIESVWPIHGSILIQNDTIYAIAGRSMFLDGGLRMMKIKPENGELISENVMGDKIPDTDDNLQTIMAGKFMPVSLPDILSSDGKYVYMKSQTFDLEGKRIRIAPQKHDVQYGEEAHLFAPISFLDDSWFHRAYFLYGRAAGEGWAEWQQPPKRVPYGRILSFDEENAYAYGRDPEYLSNSSLLEYRLYSAKKKPDSEPQKGTKIARSTVDWKKLAKTSKEQLTIFEYNWQTPHPPFLTRAMVLANDTLFVAGPPDVADEHSLWGRSNEDVYKDAMRNQDNALMGSQGAILWAVSKKDGKKLSEKKLDFLPEFDGMIAANGKLFISTTDGELICFGK